MPRFSPAHGPASGLPHLIPFSGTAAAVAGFKGAVVAGLGTAAGCEQEPLAAPQAAEQELAVAKGPQLASVKLAVAKELPAALVRKPSLVPSFLALLLMAAFSLLVAGCPLKLQGLAGHSRGWRLSPCLQ